MTISSRLSGEVQDTEAELETKREMLKAVELVQSSVVYLFEGEGAEKRVTRAADGTQRVRSYVLDPDGGSGYVSEIAWRGVALVGDEVVVEEHYPNLARKLTRFTTFNLETGVLSRHDEDNDNRGEKPLPGTTEIDEPDKLRVLQGLRWTIASLSANDAFSYEGHELEMFTNGKPRYQFEIEQLQ